MDKIYFQCCHWSIQFTDIQREGKWVDYGLKLKVSTMDIRIKQSGLKVIHSKVPSSDKFSYLRVNSKLEELRYHEGSNVA